MFRWVPKKHALPVLGPDADALLGDVPVQALRDEAAATARRRYGSALADPEYLENGWGQPHEVLLIESMTPRIARAAAQEVSVSFDEPEE